MESSKTYRRCGKCHFPGVPGNKEVTNRYGNIVEKRVVHAEICSGKCVRTFADCGYLSGHPEESEKRRLEKINNKKEKDTEKRKNEESRKIIKENKKKEQEDHALERARKAGLKLKSKMPKDLALSDYLQQRGVAEEDAPEFLHKVCTGLAVLKSNNPGYKPGEFDPDLADAVVAILKDKDATVGRTRIPDPSSGDASTSTTSSPTVATFVAGTIATTPMTTCSISPSTPTCSTSRPAMVSTFDATTTGTSPISTSEKIKQLNDLLQQKRRKWEKARMQAFTMRKDMNLLEIEINKLSFNHKRKTLMTRANSWTGRNKVQRKNGLMF